MIIALPQQADQVDSNLRRWAELMADQSLARIEGRIETDRFGRLILTPPGYAQHGALQVDVGHILHTLMLNGRGFIACPISTADGVKLADVAWASPQRTRELGNRVCFPKAPEICVEILSPSNTEGEISEKMALYFDAGATEVWICGLAGNMQFLISADAAPVAASALCPQFPTRLVLQ